MRDLWSQVAPALQVIAKIIQQGNNWGSNAKNCGEGKGLPSALVSGLNIIVIKFKQDISKADGTDTTISFKSL